MLDKAVAGPDGFHPRRRLRRETDSREEGTSQECFEKTGYGKGPCPLCSYSELVNILYTILYCLSQASTKLCKIF